MDVLEGIRVADVYHKDRKLIYIPKSLSLDGIVHTLAKSNQQYFPVVDENDKVVGIVDDDAILRVVVAEEEATA